ncbi:MAG: TrbI/VirB10 family protein [Hyphomonadaceae bacterium]|nr:TrbI/VirB10 family protein [Hyphomonadaceae bacterium]
MAREPQPPRSGLDPTFDVDASPRVGGNPTLWPMMFGIVGALGLGTVVFLQLSANSANIERQRLTDAAPQAQPLSNQGVPPAPDLTQYVEPTPPPPLIVEPMPVPVVELQPAPQPVQAGPTQAELDRLRAPALVVDLSQYAGPAQTPATTPGGNPLDPAAIAAATTNANNAGANPNESFARRLAGTGGKAARATHMGDLSTKVIEGSVIPAVLETALNSDLPGFTRAVVTRDVYGFDGSKVLVPRGSRLIGEYNSGTALGQSRAFVIWTRLIRPDGATIDLASPATDGLGRGGLSGKVDRHFLQRFGGAMLLTLLNVGASAISDSTDTSIILAGARGGADLGGGVDDIKPTVTVPQGTPVRVFVSQDLDFSSVGAVKAADAAN